MLWTKAGADNSLCGNPYPFEPLWYRRGLLRFAFVIDEVWKKSRVSPSALGLCY